MSGNGSYTALGAISLPPVNMSDKIVQIWLNVDSWKLHLLRVTDA